MALTTTKLHSMDWPNGSRLAVYRVVFDDSYPTGGETFDVSADFSGSPTVLPLTAKVTADDIPSYHVTHNGGTAAAGLLIAGAFAYTAGADSAAIEVVDTTDLAAHEVAVVVVGTAA